MNKHEHDCSEKRMQSSSSASASASAARFSLKVVPHSWDVSIRFKHYRFSLSCITRSPLLASTCRAAAAWELLCGMQEAMEVQQTTHISNLMAGITRKAKQVKAFWLIALQASPPALTVCLNPKRDHLWGWRNSSISGLLILQCLWWSCQKEVN